MKHGLNEYLSEDRERVGGSFQRCYISDTEQRFAERKLLFFAPDTGNSSSWHVPERERVLTCVSIQPIYRLIV